MPDYKVFVSSTFLDLKEHRAYVIDALRKAGFSIDPMEDWTSESDEPKEFSKERVDGCDLCILLVAFRRGHVPDGETESITQMEHRRAMERGIKVLPFLLDESAPWQRGFDEMDKDPEMRPWREWLEEHHSPGRFGLGPQTIQIAPALTRWMKARKEEKGRVVSYWLGRPASLGDDFVGREGETRRVTDAVKSHGGTVVSGGPGTGKSRLAAEYTYAWGGNGFWTEAGSDIPETLAALAPSLDVETGTRGADQIAVEVERALTEEAAETLWVIDNFTDLSFVNELLGRVGQVYLLLTTRDARKQLVPGTVDFIPLESLEQQAAVALLGSRSNCDPDDPALLEIADKVGRLPLALEMLAVRLGGPRQTPRKILGEFEKAPTALEVKAFQEAAGATIERADGVYGAIVSSLDVLDPDIRARIRPLGYLADAPIPEGLCRAITDTDEAALDVMLQACSRQSILTVRDDEIVVHALTIAAIAATNEEDALDAAVERALRRLTQINIDDPLALRSELVQYERLHDRAAMIKGAATGYSVLGAQPCYWLWDAGPA